MKRLRVVSFTVAAHCVIDDDETGLLAPIELNPMTVSPADWPNVVDIVAASLEDIGKQVQGGGGG